jgi:glycosyltransferase involved in cell wall biosynthesis
MTSNHASVVNRERVEERSSQSATTLISAILLLYNDGDRARTILEALVRGLERYGEEWEIICVDDGSQDHTSRVVEEFLSRHRNVRLIRMRTTFGEAAGLDAGLRHSSGEKVIYMTSRVNVNPEQVVGLLKKLDEGFDLVVGWRNPRRDSRLNRIVSWVFNRMINRLSGLKLNDINSGVFAARKEVLTAIPIYGDLNNFIPVMAKKQGFRITEEKIEQLPGKFRTSRYPNEYIQRFLDIITVLFLTRYSKKPIHFLGFLGAILTIIGAAINIYLFFYRILLIGPIAGRPLLLLGALLLVIGIQMVSIGLIGEMIIFTHAKEIKEYNIEEIIAR